MSYNNNKEENNKNVNHYHFISGQKLISYPNIESVG